MFNRKCIRELEEEVAKYKEKYCSTIDKCSFLLGKNTLYLNRIESQRKIIDELNEKIEEYKTKYCDEVAKRLELTERVLELEKEQNDDSGNI